MIYVYIITIKKYFFFKLNIFKNVILKRHTRPQKVPTKKKKIAATFISFHALYYECKDGFQTVYLKKFTDVYAHALCQVATRFLMLR